MEKVDALPQEVITTITNEEKHDEIEQNEPIKIEKRKPKEKPPKQPITDNQKIALEKARKVKALKQELQKHEKEMKQKPSHRKTTLVDTTVINPTPVENNDKMTELLSRISTLESALNEKKKKPAPMKEQDIDIPPVHSNPTYPFIRRIPRF